MAFLPFYWCYDAFSLLAAWWSSVVLCPALLVLITVGLDTLAGSGVVMVLLLVLVRVLSAPFLDQLLSLFHYPAGSSAALLAGTLPLRYCSFKFAARTPFWVLPVPGHVSGLLTLHDQVAVGGVEVVSSGSGSRRKRFRLNRKTPAHLVSHLVHARPRVWKRLHCSGDLCFSDVDSKRREMQSTGRW